MINVQKLIGKLSLFGVSNDYIQILFKFWPYKRLD